MIYTVPNAFFSSSVKDPAGNFVVPEIPSPVASPPPAVLVTVTPGGVRTVIFTFPAGTQASAITF